MQNEVELLWDFLKMKNKRKIKFLQGKWNNPRSKVVETWRGVDISDDKLRQRFPPISQPQYPTTVQLSESEKLVMQLPPKFTTYDKIEKNKLDVAGEVLADKIRWELRSREQREGQPWTEEKEWEDVRKKTVYDEIKGEVKFARQRVTDMPSCRRINVPEAKEDQAEVVIANMKTRLANVTKQYIKDKCDNKGNIKQQNVSKEVMEGIKSLKKRVKENELLVIPTDKSGKMVVSKN